MEFDAARARRHLPRARRARRSTPHGPVDAVGISNQRGSTVVWDRATGTPVGPGLGWQDLRTIGACLALARPGRARRPEPVGHEGPVAARAARRPGARGRPVLRHRRHVGRVDAVGRDRARDRRDATRASPACRTPTSSAWDQRGARRSSASRRDDAGDRRLGGRRRRGARAAGRAADRRARRRPAGVARRARAAFATATPRSPSAPAACSTSCSSEHAPRNAAAQRARDVPDRRVAPRRATRSGAPRP